MPTSSQTDANVHGATDIGENGAKKCENDLHEEYQYLNACKDLIQNAPFCSNRTGTNTYQKFGTQMRFTLTGNKLPLLTTNLMDSRSIIKELIWFLRGQTDNEILQKDNVNIWCMNTTREYLDSRNLQHYDINDCGPTYGFQWRHFGAEYKGCKANYDNQGIDQLSDVINTIKTNPSDRRLIVSIWNPCDTPKIPLPPCHALFQFNVEDNKYLDCQLYQRSADMATGVPFNIATYCILTHIIAKLTNLEARHFVHTFGNYHVYENHKLGLEVQLKRDPMPFPTLRIVDREQKTVDDFEYEDFVIENYNSHPKIEF